MLSILRTIEAEVVWPTTPSEAPKENYVNRIAIDKGGEATGEEYSPKLSPLKTVPIDAVSENPLVATNIPLPTDKELLTRMATSFSNVLLPICEEKQGIQHVEYIKNMLSKLSEQTIKVAEKL
jgi:hypothetical protein